MWVLLSHLLNPNQPRWPTMEHTLSVTRISDVSAGDLATTHVVSINTHYGTHVDLPSHFLPGGRTLSDIDPARFIFERPYVLEIPLGAGSVVSKEHVVNADIPADVDLLVFHSGFEAFRKNRAVYENDGPAVSADAAAQLRDSYPALRGIAIDWISVASPSNTADGADAHRLLLQDDAKGNFVVAFEDVRVSGLEGRRPTTIVALPLFIDGLEGSPCTIVANV